MHKSFSYLRVALLCSCVGLPICANCAANFFSGYIFKKLHAHVVGFYEPSMFIPQKYRQNGKHIIYASLFRTILENSNTAGVFYPHIHSHRKKLNVLVTEKVIQRDIENPKNSSHFNNSSATATHPSLHVER